MPKRKPISHLRQDVDRPPEGSWCWLSAELLASDAWRKRSPHCARLLDFLLLEHVNHGGAENGFLTATYTQLVAAGMGRRFIPEAIAEAKGRGLIVVEEGSRKGESFEPKNRYRLTWFAWKRPAKTEGRLWDWLPPTDEWRSYADDWQRRQRKPPKEREAKRLALLRDIYSSAPLVNRVEASKTAKSGVIEFTSGEPTKCTSGEPSRSPAVN